VGDNDKETLKLVSTAKPKHPSAIRPELFEDLDEHVLRLLKKDPHERPSSASELEVALTALLGNMGPSYTEPDLARTVQQHFSAEDFSIQTPKENLRAGILQAGVVLHGGETTDDLLATKTVPLDDYAKTAQKELIDLTIEKEPKKERPRRFLRLSLLLILFIVAAIFALNEIEQAEKKSTSLNNEVRPHNNLSSAAPITVDKEESALHKARAAETKNKRKSRSKVLGGDRRRKVAENDSKKGNPVPKEAEWGWLNINSYPWSYVSVDGKKLNGHTPYSRIKLTSGAHVLVFENPQLDLKTTKKVTIKAWEESNIGVRLD
jgi:serine/threonine protein kinase